MNEDLRLCPFCGGEPELINEDTYQNNYVRCPHCGVQTHPKQTQEEAITTWNTRKLNPKLEALYSLYEAFTHLHVTQKRRTNS